LAFIIETEVEIKYLVSIAQHTPVGQDFLFIEALQSQSLRPITLGTTLLDEWSPRRRDLYLKTKYTHKRQASMHSAGFEPAIPTSVWPQTHALDSAATGIGSKN